MESVSQVGVSRGWLSSEVFCCELFTIYHNSGVGYGMNNGAGRGAGIGKPGEAMSVWEAAGSFPWDYCPWCLGKAVRAELTVVEVGPSSQARSVLEAGSILDAL